MESRILNNSLRILIADDHHFFRLGLKVTLAMIPFVGDTEEASNGLETLDLLSKKRIRYCFFRH